MAEPPEMPPDVRKYFIERGREGGLIGGKKRMSSLSKEERSALGKKAVQARERKRKATTKKAAAKSAEVRSKKAAAKKKAAKKRA